MTAAAHVVFRLDASPEIGLGHLRRCVTLATKLRELGASVHLVSRQPFGPSIEPLVAGHPFSSLRSAAASDLELGDAEATIAAAGPAGERTWMVVDHYGLGQRWEKRLRDAGFRVLAIDDFRNRKHHADLLVSDAEAAFDPTLNERPGQTLVGRKYALIGPEYAYSESAAGKRAGRRLLISYGAADATGETLNALTAIRSLKDVEADVVIGPLNRKESEIRREAGKVAGSTVHIAPAGLAPLMRAADLVLTAGGNSLVEALSLRKPCLVSVTADNQELMVRQLDDEGVIRLAKPGRMAEALGETLADLPRFSAQVASQPFFDHLGPQRVAAAMLEMLSTTSRAGI